VVAFRVVVVVAFDVVVVALLVGWREEFMSHEPER